MELPPIPPHESERLRALLGYRILDTLPEQVYDDLTRLAAHICEAPIALVSLIDADRQWFKSRFGLDTPQTDRTISFCAHAVATGEMLVVPDATRDARFFDNPSVLSDPEIRFYAGAPLISPGGYPLGTLCVIDRQPREPNPEQLRMLGALSRQVMSQLELRLTIEERRRAEQARNELIGVVSHELRTPLTSIRGSLGLIEGGALGAVPAPMQPLLGIARSNTERLVRLVNDILDLERMDAGKLDLSLEPLDPADLMGAAVAGIRGMADEREVRIEIVAEADGGPPRLWGDRDRLIQVLTNLLSNAIKVSPRGGRVEARIAPADGRRMRLAVRDHGPGIREQDLGRLFARFQQLESPERKGGSGLGLAISKGIVEEHGGRMGVETRFGEGSTFWFEVPPAPAGA
jgi:signal transduction histidine kinase